MNESVKRGVIKSVACDELNIFSPFEKHETCWRFQKNEGTTRRNTTNSNLIRDSRLIRFNLLMFFYLFALSYVMTTNRIYGTDSHTYLITWRTSTS